MRPRLSVIKRDPAGRTTGRLSGFVVEERVQTPGAPHREPLPRTRVKDDGLAFAMSEGSGRGGSGRLIPGHYVLKFRRGVDHFPRVRARGFYLQTVLACVIHRRFHQSAPHILPLKLGIHFGVVSETVPGLTGRSISA